MKSFLRPIVMGALALGSMSAAALAADKVELAVVAGRPDMVSGEEVLLQVAAPSPVTIAVDGKDVTASFHPGQVPGTMIGLVQGLKRGKNEVTASAGGKVQAKLDLVDYPIAGPIFSGPHQAPFTCQTDAFKLPVVGGTLGAALDKDCAAKTRVDYVYRAKDGRLKPLPDPKAHPADLAQTKTSTGKTVNFIVRVETGTINRSIYQTALLHDPVTDPAPDAWHRSAGWNGRLLYNYGGGCQAGYHQSTSTAPVLDVTWLGLGYAMASATFNTFANNCNDVLSPETTMMVREHFIDHYGPLVHTIGLGCSGGAMQVHIIAQNYPGLLDGIVPTCTHPDVISYYTTTVADSGLLINFFNNTKQDWTTDQKTAISGFANWDPVAMSWAKQPIASPGWIVPDAPQGDNLSGCGDRSIPIDGLYDPVKNPKGARCSIYDNMVNVFGRDPKTGFARRPLDNVGVEYGLVAFNKGQITAEQFVNLNESIGGYDADGRVVAGRMVGDPEAIRIAYATGQVMTGGSGLNTTPILDVHTYVDPYDHHARIDAFMARARLVAANGDSDNQVLIELPGRNLNTLPADLLMQMDKWLDNISNDPAPLTHAKVVRNKPTDLVDACYTADNERIVEKASINGPGECGRFYPAHGNVRMAAGTPVANDILKCQLKPLDAKNYAKPLSAAEMARLKVAFPQGVCDYSKPGVSQKTVKTEWLRY